MSSKLNRHQRLTANIVDANIMDYRFKPNRNFNRYRIDKITDPDDSGIYEFSKFTRAEQNTLRGESPLIIRRLNEKLSRHAWQWNVLAVEALTTWVDEDINKYKSRVKQYCKQNNIPTEGRITFAFNGSTGHHITPWMVCHKFGHAMWPDASVAARLSKQSFLDYFGIPSSVLLNNGYRYFTFQSANEPLAWSELTFELVAQYLIEGTVRTKPDVQGGDYFVAYWNETIHHMIDSQVGKIVMDYLT